MQKTGKIKRTPAIKISKSQDAKVEKFEHPFGVKNYLLFGLALVILVAGYYFLAQPSSDPSKPPAEGFLSLNIAPILLVCAYVIVIPLAILVRKTRKKTTATELDKN